MSTVPNEIPKIKSHKEYTDLLAKLGNEFDLKYADSKPSTTPNLKDYSLIHIIGKSEFGNVAIYQHKPTEEKLVFKIMSKEQIVRKQQIDRTLHEKRTLFAMNHPFILGCFGCFKDNGFIYLVTPFIAGGDLLNYLSKSHKITETLARFFAAQVLLALEYLHCLGIVHRDIKPENILVEPNGYLKLADLGLSKRLEGRLWSFCGTPEFIAPEIILSKGYGKAVDFWSFGILIYEMCSGRSPFKSKENPNSLFEKIMTGNFEMPQSFSQHLQNLLCNLIEVDTSRRFGNLKNGINDIKSHKWFHGMKWLALFNKDMRVPSEFVINDRLQFNEKIVPEGGVPLKCLFEEEFKNH